MARPSHNLIESSFLSNDSSFPGSSLTPSPKIPLDAIGGPRLLLLQAAQLSIQLPVIFLFGRRYSHHAPDPVLSVLIPNQHGQQLLHVHAIRLSSPLSPVHFNAR